MTTYQVQLKHCRIVHDPDQGTIGTWFYGQKHFTEVYDPPILSNDCDNRELYRQIGYLDENRFILERHVLHSFLMERLLEEASPYLRCMAGIYDVPPWDIHWEQAVVLGYQAVRNRVKGRYPRVLLPHARRVDVWALRLDELLKELGV